MALLKLIRIEVFISLIHLFKLFILIENTTMEKPLGEATFTSKKKMTVSNL